MNVAHVRALFLLSVLLGSSATPAQSGSPTPRQPDGYLPVEDVPSGSDNDVITPAQRAKIEAELIAARDRQAAALQNAQAK